MTGLFPGLGHVTNMKRIRSDFSIISLPPPKPSGEEMNGD